MISLRPSSCVAAFCGALVLTGGAPFQLTAASHGAEGSASAHSAPDERVVLVVLDGTRWQEVFEGVGTEMAQRYGVKERSASDLVPTLHRWTTLDGAAIGAPERGAVMRASGPSFVSLPGYTELLTGRLSPCTSNACGPAAAPTLLDEVADAWPDGAAAVASWDALDGAVAMGRDRVISSAGRRRTRRLARLAHHEESAVALLTGAAADSWPGHDGYRPDADTARLALAVAAKERPRLLFVSLGDTDEHAHHDDYGRYLDALQSADAFLGRLERELEQSGALPHTTILVTADHGRADSFRDHGAEHPESSRVWLVARGGKVRARGPLAATEEHALRDVAPTVRAILDLPRREAPDGGHAMRELLTP